MRDLIVTQTITLDGVIDAEEGWFGPSGEDEGIDQSDIVPRGARTRPAAGMSPASRTKWRLAPAAATSVTCPDRASAGSEAGATRYSGASSAPGRNSGCASGPAARPSPAPDPG